MKETKTILSQQHFKRALIQDDFYHIQTKPRDFWNAFDLFVQEKADLGAPIDLLKDYGNNLRKHLLLFERWSGMTINFMTFHQKTGNYEKFVEYLTFVALNNLRRKNQTMEQYIEQQLQLYKLPENTRRNLQRPGLKINTIGKIIKNLKAFLQYSMDREYMPPHSLKHFKVAFELVDNAYVCEEELQAIRQLEIPPGTRKELVRDLFLFCCYTGFRYGDLLSLVPSNFDRGMVNKLTGKTGKRVVVPLNPIALGIAEKYQFQIAGRITYEQEFNELIKEICKEAGLNQLFRKICTVNGVRREDVFQKWEVISSHTCRRSFCTNLFKKGMNLEDIALFSGHSAIRILKIYIKLTPEEKVLNFLDYFR